MQGLEEAIGVSVVHPTWQKTKPADPSDEHYGWTFAKPDDPPFQSPSGELCYAYSNAASALVLETIADIFVCFQVQTSVRVRWGCVQCLLNSAHPSRPLYLINGGLNGIQVP